MDGYGVRDFRDEDYPEVLGIWRRTSLYSEERADDLEVIRSTIKLGGRLLVLVHGNKIIGTSWLTSDGRRMFIQYFAILPEYQGKGLSHLLMEESLEFARKLGLQVKLEVHRDNEIAKNLYRKWGFKPLGDYEVYILRDIGNRKS